jgi:FAD/FMN-containing dehydrogenase/Fe-S oxidoreductase
MHLPLHPESAGSPSPPVSSKDRQVIARELANLDAGEVRFDEHNRLLYSTDASLYQVKPIGVVIPRDADAVAKVVQYCAARGIALLPRGGGTSLAGQCTNHALVLDVSPTMNGVVEVDAERQTCRVRPGITIDALNRDLAARKTGLFFAPDPATVAQASIGGCIGNNAAGARSIRYGRTSENVLGVEVVLSSGDRLWLRAGAGRQSPIAARLAAQVAQVVREYADDIRARFPRLVRRNAGYGLDLILRQLDDGVADEDLDLSGLICGSEGTLGVVVAADLKLCPAPLARGLAITSFGQVDEAIDAVMKILPTRPAAVELLDDAVFRAAAGNFQVQPYLEMFPRVDGQTPQAALYVEYQIEREGEGEGESQTLDAFFDALRGALPGAAMTTFTDAAEMARAWTLRKSSEALLHGLPGKAKPITFVEDNSIPVENLARFVREFRHIVTSHGTEAAYYAHASVGVLHVRPMIDLHSPDGRKNMRDIAVEVAELARQWSGDHGDGRVRGPLLADFYGPRVMAAFKRIKAIFDPAGVFNPGNIVDAGPVASITENLRVDANSPAVDVNAIDTYFDYPGEEGFAGAIELCNGAGFCRKTAGGVMCPSYRATLDERHSTRGRANAIRLAVTGQTGDASAPAWDDEAVKQTLELCLGCKACKTECPSNVDVAQLKAEVYGQRHRSRGTPISARLLGNVRALNRMGSIAPKLANWLAGRAITRAMLEKLIDLSPHRRLPPFAPSLRRWFNRRPPRAAGPRVALFPDCFVTYSEPHIGQAAVGVLEKLGYRVELPQGGCCGRAMISAGLLDDAIATADRTIGSLRAVIENSAIEAIIVFEPSCLSAIKDEWLKLKLHSPMELRQRLADKAMLFEDFVHRRWEAHPNRPVISPKAGARDVILHGHCHQKALWGVESTAALLRRFAGERVMVLPSGCCGMAGAFGYTRQRYDLSMKIGELSVFPPIRGAGAEAMIVAPGTSCRHQIKDGTSRAAIHPAEFVAQMLEP